ncbi:MAG: radical SAM family heme chaperone HemW [Clostridiales bacterium]|nr:radical SAM family heme chaperone HemW [Clostridiales bacterium]
MNKLRIYIHIPFCQSKCQYCDFISYDNKDYLIDSYIDSVIREIELSNTLLKNKEITSIFLGGGTPTYLPAKYIRKILSKLSFTNQSEVSIEINPETVTKDKLIDYKKMGINRLSFGVQSLDNKLLRLMGRIHDKHTAIDSIILANELGFENISADLIFGYPLQTLEIYEKTIDEILTLPLKHLSCYSLSVEKDTTLHSMINKKILPTPNEQLDRRMYEITESKLLKYGFLQYELSNYAKKGYESKHNIGYWKQDEYLSFGLGAHSYYNHKRFHNTYDLPTYIRNIKQNILKQEEIENITLNEQEKEFIMLRLRLNEGFSLDTFKEKFSCKFTEKYEQIIKKLTDDNLINISSNKVSLTDKGKDFSNQVFLAFF